MRGENKRKMNKNNIYFSIIMPTYNRAFCIEKAINSLLKQTYQNYELIIIDDGSTDNTEDLIRDKYSDLLKNKKIIYKKIHKNIGVCKARNIGLNLAKNEWIAYLDSDNEILPNYLEEYVLAIKENPGTKVFYAKLQRTDSKIIGKPFNHDQLIEKNYIDMGVFVHHRSLINQCGKFDTKLKRGVDWDLIIRYTQNNRPVFIDKILLMYNCSNEFSRISNTEDGLAASIYIREKARNKQCLSKQIFSVKNNGIHKVVTFCGLKLKIKSKKLIQKQIINSLNEKICLQDKELKEINTQYKALKEQTYCPICRSYNSLISGGTNKRPKAKCSQCGAFERHRFLYFIYNFLFLNTSKKIKLLHIAPEHNIYELIKKNQNIEYVAMDIEPERFTFLDNCIKGDVRNMPFSDKCFDVIIHNQVIEHIDNEKQFIDECIRVLKDNGLMIINIPYSPHLEKTFESQDIVTEEDREKYYYQKDHVRLYGSDMLKNYDYLNITKLDESIMTEELINKMQLKRDISLEKSLSDAYFIVKK